MRSGFSPKGMRKKEMVHISWNGDCFETLVLPALVAECFGFFSFDRSVMDASMSSAAALQASLDALHDAMLCRTQNLTELPSAPMP